MGFGFVDAGCAPVLKAPTKMKKTMQLFLRISMKSCAAAERVVFVGLRHRVSIRGHGVLEHTDNRR